MSPPEAYGLGPTAFLDQEPATRNPEPVLTLRPTAYGLRHPLTLNPELGTPNESLPKHLGLDELG
jgi:hypothetical protein